MIPHTQWSLDDTNLKWQFMSHPNFQGRGLPHRDLYSGTEKKEVLSTRRGLWGMSRNIRKDPVIREKYARSPGPILSCVLEQLPQAALTCWAELATKENGSSRHKRPSQACLRWFPWLRLGVYWSTCPKGQHSGVGTAYLTLERVSTLLQGVPAAESLFMMPWYWDFINQRCNWAGKGSWNLSQIYPSIDQFLAPFLDIFFLSNKVPYLMT